MEEKTMSNDSIKAAKEPETKDDQPVVAGNLFDLIGYEAFAIHLMLTAPTDLAKAWGATTKDTQVPAVMDQHLPNLTLSIDGAKAVRMLGQELWSARNAFLGVGQHAGVGIYGGSEPHPELNHLRKIIDALKVIPK
jgi:hypothetical protein